MNIVKVRERVETLWCLAHSFLCTNTDRKKFHGISYYDMIETEKALRITVGMLRHVERKYLIRLSRSQPAFDQNREESNNGRQNNGCENNANSRVDKSDETMTATH